MKKIMFTALSAVTLFATTGALALGILGAGCVSTTEPDRASQGAAGVSTVEEDSTGDPSVFVCRPSLGTAQPICTDSTHRASCSAACKASFGVLCVAADSCDGS